MNFNAATTATATNLVAVSEQQMLEEMSPLERVKHFLGYERYSCPQLSGVVSYPEEGNFKGKALMKLEPEQIFGKEDGWFRISLAFARTNEAQVPTVKVSISYILKGGQAVLLSRGGYDEANAKGWTGITTNPVPLSGLFDGGFIAPSCQERVWKWWQANNGLDTSLPLLIKGSLVATLRVTKMMADPEEVGNNGRVRKTKLRKGDWANLGVDAIGFSGAELMPMQSSLIGVDGSDAVQTIAQMQERFGGGAAAVEVSNEAGL